nr:sensor histidine kinase [Paracoccus saliphilus]
MIPKSASIFDYEVRAQFPDVGQRTMLLSAQRIEHPDSRQRVLLLSIVDATARRKKEEEKDILIGEFDHRIKNLLSVVHALARQTRVADCTAEEYRDNLIERFDALGRSLEVSAQKDARQLADLITRIMEPYRNGTSRIKIAGGPQVYLSPPQTMSLGMMMHEMATNALKYGALSVPDGQVSIAWTIEKEDGSPVVRFIWHENDGPTVAPPTGKGFGTNLIKFSVEQELGGTVELRYPPDGFVAELTFPPL